MRYPLARIAFLVACVLADAALCCAQSVVSGDFTILCSPLTAEHEQVPPRPKLTVAGVTFPGVLDLPIPNQREIAASIQRSVGADRVDQLVDQALEAARAGWQNHGYFKAEVTGSAHTLPGGGGVKRVALVIRVNEGTQYRLTSIAFKNINAIRDDNYLRDQFPIKDGDVFSREKIAQGLENLRKTYAESGYLNFTAIPNAILDDERKLISLALDLDEGKQFHLGSVNIIGLDESSSREVRNDLDIGGTYNEKLIRRVLEKYSAKFRLASDDPRLIERHIDVKTGAVVLTLYACPCSACY